MSSVQRLRAFVTERLTAAAEEILGAFAKTIADYEEEIDRQRRLLDVVRRPEVKLHRIALLQKCDVATEQQLCENEKASLDQEEPDPPKVKEEQDELCLGQKGEQLVLKQETGDATRIPPDEQSDHREQKATSDQQLCNLSSPGAEHNIDSESTRITEPQPKKKRHENTNNSRNTGNSPVTEMQSNTSSGKMPPECNFCGKKCMSSFSLKEHLKIHTGEKPYVCEICGKGFSRASTLNIHIRIHSGQNLHLCNICGKSFNEWSELRSHAMSHTDEKPYRCTSCGDSFFQLSHMKNHIKIHTREYMHAVKSMRVISDMGVN